MFKEISFPTATNGIKTVKPDQTKATTKIFKKLTSLKLLSKPLKKGTAYKKVNPAKGNIKTKVDKEI